MVLVPCIPVYMDTNYARDRTCFCNKIIRTVVYWNSNELWQISYSSKDVQPAEHPLYKTVFFSFFLFFPLKNLVFSILFDEKYFVYRSIIPNFKKNNGIKWLTTLMKVTGEQLAVLRSLGFSRNVSGQKLLVYHILILNHRGAKLYYWRRANIKILKSAPGLLHVHVSEQAGLSHTWSQTPEDRFFHDVAHLRFLQLKVFTLKPFFIFKVLITLLRFLP